MPRRGVSLIELLVSISILGVLTSLLLPAVQAAREAARQAQCRSHLRQIALGLIQYHEAFTALPSGGWGWRWVGDPDRGFGPAQPGGWIYSVLPFLEESDLHSLGQGLSGQAKLDASARRLQTPLAIMVCPSRREADIFPTWCDSCGTPLGSSPVQRVARADYAANAGDHRLPWDLEGPPTLEMGDQWTEKRRWPFHRDMGTGVIFLRSTIGFRDVTDGTTKTYLVGEKYVNSNEYTTGRDWADNESMYCGFNNDNHRSTHPDWPAMRDNPVLFRDGSFGSPHAGGFFMAMCDGSVSQVSYGIDPDVHRRAGRRRD